MSAQRQYVYFDGQWVDENVSFFSKLLIRFISWCEKTFKLLLYICKSIICLDCELALTSTRRTCKSHDWLMYIWSLVNIVIVDCMHAIGRSWWTEREKEKWTLKSISLFSFSLFACCTVVDEKDIDCICLNAEQQQRKKPIWIDAYNRVVLLILYSQSMQAK